MARRTCDTDSNKAKANTGVEVALGILSRKLLLRF